MDSVLTGANQAVSSGMLVRDAVTAVLNTGLALMHSRLVRPHSAPAASWTVAINRLVEWGEGNIDSFDPLQYQQLSILVPCADQDVSKLRAVLDEIHHAGMESPQLKDWVDFGEVSLKVFTAQQWFEGLLGGEDVPEGVRLIRTIDGGGEVRWWPVMMDDEPLLAFVTVSASMYVGGEVSDPMRGALIAAGFPVIVEKGFEGADFDGWMGHYELITGYDDAARSFTAYSIAPAPTKSQSPAWERGFRVSRANRAMPP